MASATEEFRGKTSMTVSATAAAGVALRELRLAEAALTEKKASYRAHPDIATREAWLAARGRVRQAHDALGTAVMAEVRAKDELDKAIRDWKLAQSLLISLGDIIDVVNERLT